jgi:hypothetical protein
MSPVHLASDRQTEGRTIRLAFWCGLIGYALSWFLHLAFKAFLRAASPYGMEGSAAAICGGVLAAMLTRPRHRDDSRPVLRAVKAVATLMAVPVIVLLMGISGMMIASQVTSWSPVQKMLIANQNHRIGEWAYWTAPFFWTFAFWIWSRRRGSSDSSPSSVKVAPADVVSQPTEDSKALKTRKPIDDAALVRWEVLASLVFTWMIHKLVVSRIGWAIWGREPAEAAPLLLASGMISAITLYYFARTVRGPRLRLFGPQVLAQFIGGFCGLLGVTGHFAAQSVYRLMQLSPFADELQYAYDIVPLLWAIVIVNVVCWYYRATHGGASLLNFDPLGRYDVAPPK